MVVDPYEILGTFEKIKLEMRGRVLVATLNRPEVKNAIDEVLRFEIRKLFNSLIGRQEIGVVVLTGAGDAFCSGGDASMLTDFMKADWRLRARNLENGILTLRDLLSIQQPVIAAVNGPATGLGATIALACDWIVMADTATIADTHVKIGIVAGDGGTLMWPAILGQAKAKQFLLTGDKVTAIEAERMGMVTEVAEVAKVVERAIEVATRLAEGSRYAIEWTKHAINTRMLRDLYEQLPFSLALEAATFEQPDLAEGLKAFKERRPPVWPSSHPDEH